MADRTYYFELEFAKEELSRIRSKPDNFKGVHAEDLVTAQQEARAQILARLVGLVGKGEAQTLDAAWVDEGTSWNAAVPVQIQRVARLLSSAIVWQMEERYHGLLTTDKKKERVSDALLKAAEAAWLEIESRPILVMPVTGNLVDLTALGTSTGKPYGIAGSPVTFFGNRVGDDGVDGVATPHTLEQFFLAALP